jgi:hypothetical protein
MCPIKLSFRHEGKIMTFQDKQKLKELIIPRPATKILLKVVLYLEAKGIYQPP